MPAERHACAFGNCASRGIFGAIFAGISRRFSAEAALGLCIECARFARSRSDLHRLCIVHTLKVSKHDDSLRTSSCAVNSSRASGWGERTWPCTWTKRGHLWGSRRFKREKHAERRVILRIPLWGKGDSSPVSRCSSRSRRGTQNLWQRILR